MNLVKRKGLIMKIAIDENILIKDEICTAGSKMLHNFKSPYSAAVVDKIKEVGYDIVYRSKVGEFGVGTNTGNDSAAYAVSSGAVDAALGIDVDGAAYRSAAEHGVVYIKPTYGTVSRFGVVANISSVDQVGVYAKNFDDGFAVLSVIAGHDENDGTSYPNTSYNYHPADNFEPQRCVNLDCFTLAEYLVPTYQIISSAEFSTNISRFDGLKFDYRTENYSNMSDMVTNSRSEGFTSETKIKALMGTYVLAEGQFEKYYYKATQIRHLIKQELDEIFKNADFVRTPLSEVSAALANLTGCPSIAVNGEQIIAKEFDENKLFAFGKLLQK